MKRFFFLAGGACVAFASLVSAQTATDPNEGLRMTPDPEFPNGFILNWWGHPGRVYFIENSPSLAVGSWTNAPLVEQGRNAAFEQRFFAQGERFFTRLRSIDGVLDPIGEDRDHDGVSTGEETIYGSTKTNPIAYTNRDLDDNDSDGLPDAWEWTYLKTLNFAATDQYDPAGAPGATCLALYQSLRPDTDGDSLPDDWERQRRGDLSEDGSDSHDGNTNLELLHRDRLVLARHRYGSHVFAYDESEPRNPFSDPTTSTDPRVVYLRSENGGSMIATYTDATYQTVQSLRVYPGHPNYGDPTGATEEPPVYYADYTGAESGGAWIYAFDAPPGGAGIVARDLLRTIDSRPWRRTYSGARQPARLAITSLPLTQAGGGQFPLVLRDFPSGKAAFPDFPAGFGVSDTEILEPVLDGSPHRGRPVLKANPKPNSSIRSRHTFSQWYRHTDAFGFTTSQLIGPNDSCPPGFTYGVYRREFRPQLPDVGMLSGEAKSLFTAEFSMRLDYDLSHTELFVQADDVAWVFIDGHLAIDSTDPFVYGDRWPLSVLKTYVESRDGPGTDFLASPTGTCRVDIFYADTRPYDTRFVAMSNSPLKPVYIYQVVAETELDAALTYSLVTAPAGMEIDPQTGRIVWDFHALNADSDPNNNISSDGVTVTVQVSDPIGRSDTQSFTLNVSL